MHLQKELEQAFVRGDTTEIARNLAPAREGRPKTDHYEQLRKLQRMQKSLVRQYTHNAMSPISAISGYLDLMKMFLEGDMDKQRLERYRSKIAEGVDELSDIVEELHEAIEQQDIQIEKREGVRVNNRKAS